MHSEAEVPNLQEALEEVAWPEDLPWDEAQAVTAEAPTVVQNVDDDLERELAFYNQVHPAAGLYEQSLAAEDDNTPSWVLRNCVGAAAYPGANCPVGATVVQNVDDGLERELAFYTQVHLLQGSSDPHE